jgi:hypothetical protein
MQTQPRLTFAALCAIARRVLEHEPGIDDAEWKERIKCHIAREHRAYPTPIELGAALSAVETAIAKSRGPQLAPAPLTPEPAASRPLSGDESRAALAHLRARFGPLPGLKPRAMPTASPGDDERKTRARYRLVLFAEQLRTIARLRRAERQPRST